MCANPENQTKKYLTVILTSDIIIYLFILTANWFLPDDSGTTMKHNTLITHITQNTPRSNTRTKSDNNVRELANLLNFDIREIVYYGFVPIGQSAKFTTWKY
jgi:hypothetical protein